MTEPLSNAGSPHPRLYLHTWVPEGTVYQLSLTEARMGDGLAIAWHPDNWAKLTEDEQQQVLDILDGWEREEVARRQTRQLRQILEKGTDGTSP